MAGKGQYCFRNTLALYLYDISKKNAEQNNKSRNNCNFHISLKLFVIITIVYRHIKGFKDLKIYCLNFRSDFSVIEIIESV
jgi:hypothetical protein